MTLARRIRPSFAGILFAFAIVLVASSQPAAAGPFDFLFSLDQVHNDTQYFLNLAVGHSGTPRHVLEPLLPRVRHLEPDLPVLLYLQRASGWPLPQLVDLRAQGPSWSAIFTHVGVPQGVLFEGIPDDPGPPYGNAWGYWKKNPRGARLRDSDVSDLVRIQMASGWVGARPSDLARGYAHGVTAPIYVAEKNGRPYRHGAGEQGKDEQKAGHGHSAGHGKPHGNPHGKPHGKPPGKP